MRGRHSSISPRRRGRMSPQKVAAGGGGGGGEPNAVQVDGVDVSVDGVVVVVTP